MATRPDKFPDWAEDDVTSPISGQNNVVEPSAAKQAKGWDYREKPVRQFMNWLQRYYGRWIRYLDEGKLTTADNLSDLDDVPTARDNLGLGTGALEDVTTSATDTTAGRLLKVGDINAVGRVDYREVLSTPGASLSAYRSYHIASGTNYSLPATASLLSGASVVLSKALSASPDIITPGTEQIESASGLSDTYTYDVDSEIILVWNGINWQVVSGEVVGQFDNQLTDTGYQILPGGMIMQWGKKDWTGAIGNFETVTFPLEFPNACLNVTTSQKTGGTDPSNGNIAVDATTVSTTGFEAWNPTGTGANLGLYWFAVGY